ncbi:zinc-binding alcohol dehydrogenase family protein [Rossellomorea vietnamensis]|uniref:quinone oxidoreductase family protein n=1 Tax=Rossellomorea vietnamensis TaxID=218284 RepID=UPI00308C5DA2|nr:zinc-binding dehydrogenase [Rossellomorea vietnamensis]WQI95269.1 zinc-binding dehydrogenase [Rossellomorea vietnamensis]
MKAVIQHEFGGSHVLQLAEVETPTITEEEVLLKTAYTSVNYADIKSRRGNKGKGKFPLTLGLDATGTVVEAGTSSGFSEGDRVIAFPKGGSYAEYVKAHKQLTFRIPESLSFEQAAAMPTVSILSYLLLHDIGQVKKSDTIVVHSGAGGVGSMLIQLAKLAGVETVMATVGNLSKEDYVKRMGAEHVCTYDTFSEEVLQLTYGNGADVVFDSVAGEVTTASLACLGLYGTLVQFGNSSGSAGHFKTSDVHSSCRNVKGFSLGTTRKHRPDMLAPAAERVIELFAAGKVTLPIAKVFDLSDAKQAHDLIESRAYEGKVLIKA